MLQTSLPAMIMRCIIKKAKTRVAIVDNNTEFDNNTLKF